MQLYRRIADRGASKSLAIACLVLLLCVSRVLGQTDDFPTPEVRQIIDDFRAKKVIPGISVAVIRGDEICFDEGFGWADAENRVTATEKTLYRTASIAKPMTATVMMRLKEEGLIDLDQDIRTYYARFPAKKWPITSRQLLSHLGGVRHYKSAAEASSTRHYYNTQSAIDVFAADPLEHEPGTKYKYSSFGYNLVGAVLEEVGKESFEALLQKHLWKPAGMDFTTVDDSFLIIPNRTSGYFRFTPAQIERLPEGHRYKAGTLYNAPLHDTSMKVPGGGLLSTPSDLCRFASALQHGLLSPASLREMWTVQRPSEGPASNYALGWSIHDDGTVSHGGGQSGTATLLLVDPQQKIAVAAMCNLQSTPLRDLCYAILRKAAADKAPQKPASDEDVKKQLEAAILWEMKEKKLPAFSIAIIDNQQTLYSAGFGEENVRQEKKANADSIYRVGSLSKLFTDIAVMQLVEKGELDLDADIRSVLPDFQPINPHSTPLTLRMLMTHQSGLVREPPVGHYFDAKQPSLSETVSSLNRTTLTYAPNTRTKYSNAAVAVAGFALQTHTRQKFEDYLKQTILDPIGMTSSEFQLTPAVESHLAAASMWTVDGRRFPAPKFELGTAPAGSLYSSVNDMAKFVKVILNEGKIGDTQVISNTTLQEMIKPRLDDQGKSASFGIGFGLSRFEGQHAVGHGGAIYGYSTQLRILPESKLGVIGVTSLDGANGVVRRLTDYALRLVLTQRKGEDLPNYKKPQSIPAVEARKLAGLYKAGDKSIRLTERDGHVFVRQGAYRRELRQLDGRLIVDDVHGYDTAWGPHDENQLLVGGKTFRRIEDPLPPPAPEKWRKLIGEYGWDHNTLYIFEDQGQLFALIEWFYYYPLTEISESEFAFPDYGLYHGERLQFSLGGDGKVESVVAAEVKFERRPVGPEDGATFRIKPLRPVSELLAEAQAAKPPQEVGAFLPIELVDVAKQEGSIHLDIRYATDNNFMGAVFYDQPRAFMQAPAAKAVVAAHRSLKSQGYGLLIHDAYRPWYVTKTFWDATPGSMKDFVANPDNGSRHNRGCAVDLTMYHLDSGEPVQTVAGYDEFSHRSFPAYPGGTSRQRWHRELLRKTMQDAGFTIYEYEWWHFDFKAWKLYPISNVTFEEIDQ
jgi:CubicO group peptidase (beta-lactamase class C family)/D-alanyl-D-alanine dipeptidase